MINPNKNTTTVKPLTKEALEEQKKVVKKGTLVRLSSKKEGTIKVDVDLGDSVIWVEVYYARATDTFVESVTFEAKELDINSDYLLLERLSKRWSFTGSKEEIEEAFLEFHVYDKEKEYRKKLEEYEDSVHKNYLARLEALGGEKTEEDLVNEKLIVELEKPTFDKQAVIESFDFESYAGELEPLSADDLKELEELPDYPLYYIPVKTEVMYALFPSLSGKYVSKIWETIINKLNPTIADGAQK